MRAAALIALVLLLTGSVGRAENVSNRDHMGPYVTVEPYRVLDTRPATPAGSVTTVDPFVPFGAVAAAVNITIDQVSGPGFLTAWDGVGARPLASVVNADGPGQIRANFSIVPLNIEGNFAIYNQMQTGIIVDVMGFVAGPLYSEANSFVWTPGTTIDFIGKTLPVLKGDASLIDACAGAVLYHGDFDSVAWIGAHRTACGDYGFGGLELITPGTQVQIHSSNQVRSYQFTSMTVAPLGIAPDPPPGTSLVLQTSETASTVYLLFFQHAFTQ